MGNYKITLAGIKEQEMDEAEIQLFQDSESLMPHHMLEVLQRLVRPRVLDLRRSEWLLALLLVKVLGRVLERDYSEKYGSWHRFKEYNALT